MTKREAYGLLNLMGIVVGGTPGVIIDNVIIMYLGVFMGWGLTLLIAIKGLKND